MPKLIVIHEVEDVRHWLDSPKREEVFAGVASSIETYVHPEDTNRVALSMDVTDMDSFRKVVESDAGAEAMKYDGVRPETLTVFVKS